MTAQLLARAVVTSSALVAAQAVWAASPDAPAELPTYLREERDGFIVLYHPSLGDRVRHALDDLPEIRAELERDLGTEVLRRVDLEVTLAPHVDTRASTRTRVVLPSNEARTSDEVRARLRFELARQALREAADGAVPAWFERAYAERFSGSTGIVELTRMIAATVTGEVPDLSSLRDLDEEACARGCAAERAAAVDFARFVASHEGAMARLVGALRGDDGPPRDPAVGRASSTMSFDAAVGRALDVDAASVGASWHRASAERHWIVVIIASLGLGLALWLAGRWLARRLRRAAAPRQLLPARRRRVVRAESPQPSPDAASRNPRRGGREVAAGLRARAQRARGEVPRVEHDGRWHTLH